MTTSLQTVGLSWQGMPVHPIKRASTIVGGSQSQVYNLLKAGELKAVTLGGKTLITTASLIDYLAKAQPWTPNRDRVAKAVAGRPDVARKAANLKRIAKVATRSKTVRKAARKTAARGPGKGEMELTER